MNDARPDDERIWRTEEALHVDVRGLEPPGPMIAILRLIDGDQVDGALIAHLDREPIFLYPELHERGWAYELLPHAGGGCGGEDSCCGGGVRLQMVRLGP